jgi:hypothetical protein
MRRSREARASDQSDRLFLLHLFSFLHQKLRQVQINRHDALSVINQQGVAVQLQFPDPDDAPRFGGPNDRTPGRLDVHAPVVVFVVSARPIACQEPPMNGQGESPFPSSFRGLGPRQFMDFPAFGRAALEELLFFRRESQKLGRKSAGPDFQREILGRISHGFYVESVEAWVEGRRNSQKDFPPSLPGRVGGDFLSFETRGRLLGETQPRDQNADGVSGIGFSGFHAKGEICRGKEGVRVEQANNQRQ